MYKQPQIYLLTHKMLRDRENFHTQISSNTTNNYYWSDDFSCEFYIELAKKGFISTTYDTKGGLVLLPELQYAYALLDFENLHISKKVQKLLNLDTFTFIQNHNFAEVLEKLSDAHKDNWLKGEYEELMLNLYANNGHYENFSLSSFELRCPLTHQLIAGEVGYMIGTTYTSLSGFSSREKKYNNYGTLQLVLLAQFLEKNHFTFWNLGHPHMEYKKKLGAKVYPREDFLKRWEGATTLPTIYSSAV